MSLDRNITISGTDPGNPRCAAHVVERLEQIKRDVEAMHTEAGRLWSYAGFIRDVLREAQGVPDAEAVRRTQDAVRDIAALREALDEVHGRAVRSIAAVEATGVNLRSSFHWHPARTEV